ncbi:uncharacterized protein BO97DRAFT_357967 [Aspergillus homomorphus CBS 101889]|uniref:Uracil-DNA glycosylase-like domain-containing protein n=1 Tax=Aspergillus homomorphus (strain CBS 101889) TaxID=1450537 RepID=A0A395HGC3_ASPHC|nr:hypothetical protein BO97DRAFT_357967 [Aspergillus homomorphus CBS 101889]RAL06800.1 hypothetical protein BO97DRAFT_357967 [Aspergillus homomorphus CBS 101889]
MRQWFRLGTDELLFAKAREFQRRYSLNTNCYKNHIRLAAGYCHMPVIILQNPCNNHTKDFYDMFTQNSALKIIRDILEDIGLNIDDVPILDLCPMISDQWAQTRAQSGHSKEVLQAIYDAYDLTTQYLEVLQPATVIVLQCATNQSAVGKHPFLGNVNHPVAQRLCSSMDEAMGRKSRVEQIVHHQVRMVAGFHPSRIWHESDPALRKILATTLRDILSSVYVPYAQQIGTP